MATHKPKPILFCSRLSRRVPLGALLLSAGVLAACGDDTVGTATDGTSDTGDTATTAGPTGPSSSSGVSSSSSSASSGSTTAATTDAVTSTSPTSATSSTTAAPTTDPETGSSTDATTGTDTDTDTDTDTGGLESTIRVGASWATLLPEVDGSTAYFDVIAQQPPLALEPGDPGDDPGVFVEAWDVGGIAIGNGFPTSHWVHDEIRAGAIAFQDAADPLETILVLATADVYMLFRPDLKVVHDKVQLLLDDDATYNKLRFVVAATHNHMGPDTSGLDALNPEYYEYLADQMALAIVEAVQNLEPAILATASSAYQFGLADQNAPYLVDPTLHTLQARAVDDDAILATVLQWQSHPETTLGFGKNVFASDEQAAYLKSVNECYTEDDENCYVEGQYISAGFPGYAVRHIMEQTDAPALYFNGGVGAMMSPLRYPAWETDGPDGIPAGDGMMLPADAVSTGKSFHKLAVIGWELGKRALDDLGGDVTTFMEGPVEYNESSFFTRLSNVQFRVGLTVVDDDPIQIGYKKRLLYTCPPLGPKDDETCLPDNYQSEVDPILALPVRLGDHAKTAIVNARVGPIELLTAPGEVVTELTHGLPADFKSDPDEVYYGSGELRMENLVNHHGPDVYTTPGYARQAMTGEFKWIFGLSQDAGGYILPPDHFRIYCVGDDFNGPGTCQALWQAGIIDYESYDQSTYGLAGARCKAVTEDPDLLGLPPYTLIPGADQIVAASCAYGVALGEFSSHYEETNSMGWDAGADWLNAVWSVTGYEQDIETVNPEFIGKNVANL